MMAKTRKRAPVRTMKSLLLEPISSKNMFVPLSRGRAMSNEMTSAYLHSSGVLFPTARQRRPKNRNVSACDLRPARPTRRCRCAVLAGGCPKGEAAAPRLNLLHDSLAQQPARLDEQDNHENHKSDRILERRRQINARKRFGQAQDKPAEHRARMLPMPPTTAAVKPLSPAIKPSCDGC